MSKMLSKMNLISVVQQLPDEDIELVQNYVEMIENENVELKKQLEEKKEWINLLNKFKNQQQEFIKYLEESQFVPSITGEDFEEDYTITEALQKYKEIIGDSDER